MPVPGVEVTDETVKLPPYVSAVLCFALARFGATEETVTFRVTQVWQTVLLPGIEVAEKTVFASRNASALPGCVAVAVSTNVPNRATAICVSSAAQNRH